MTTRQCFWMVAFMSFAAFVSGAHFAAGWFLGMAVFGFLGEEVRG